MIPHNIPINGRIAIVDDQIDQALPVMRLFSKLQIPYVYFGSDYEHLPEKGSAYNDVRILFLDINLIDNRRRKENELKASLIPIIDRIVSEDNYPYLLIYWSRHEEEYHGLVEEIFQKDLPKKAPISYLSLQKSAFVKDDGKPTELDDQPDLLGIIKTELSKYPVYGHLINWENQVHVSADHTLEEIFKLKSYGDDWNQQAEFLFYKLALAYSGKNLKDYGPMDQIRSAFLSLNSVFLDSLEHSIGNNLVDFDCKPLDTEAQADSGIIMTLNRKLLLSEDASPSDAPGIVLKVPENEEVDDYKQLVITSFNWKDVQDEIRAQVPGISSSRLRVKCSEFRAQISDTGANVILAVTPLCDFTQRKNIFIHTIRGLLIKSKYKRFLHRSSEALYTSPDFRLSAEEEDMAIVLDYRHLFAQKSVPGNLEPLFRMRQQVMAEIQSKLSRFMNRQGILFLE
jgi:hypothetical protein